MIICRHNAIWLQMRDRLECADCGATVDPEVSMLDEHPDDSPRDAYERNLFLAAFRGPRGPL